MFSRTQAGYPQRYPDTFNPFAQGGFGSYSTGPGTGGLQWNYGSGWSYGGGQGGSQQNPFGDLQALTGIPGDEMRDRMNQWQQTNQAQQQIRNQTYGLQPMTAVRPVRNYANYGR